MTMETTGAPDASDKRMRLRYAGICRLCGTALPARADAIYERGSKTVRCVDCATTKTAAGAGPTVITEPAAMSDSVVPEVASDNASSDVPETAVDLTSHAGSSARREYERRRARDEERLRQKWGRLGGVAVALSDEKQSTRAWATGAVGEERLAARLEAAASPTLAILHDRRIPGTRANIDHIAITPSGVWVIDAKRYKNQRPSLAIEGGILRPRVEKLMVGRGNRTNLVDGVLKQMEVVRPVLRELVDDAKVTGALCFVDADWPLIGGSFTTRGVHVLWPKRLIKQLHTEGPAVLDVTSVHERLAQRLPPA
ncbi:nuclease-related domain-containing protein [Janibacter anophelis]|uniref:nuclease-related domain-containing protein n=1 Tax=Janibacter anophelis TaxID=319054 RepID=UPI003F7EDFA1